MQKDTVAELRAAWGPTAITELAADMSPLSERIAALGRLRDRWTKRFAELAEKIGQRFAENITRHVDRSMRSSLRRGGFVVNWHPTAAQTEGYQAVLAENVGLIKSIAPKYHDQIQGMVMRSVVAGGDLHQLVGDLQREYGVTRRRAELIARDQNNKASAVMTRIRQQEVGIDEAIWVHAGAAKHPRPSHVKAGKDRLRYKISEGALIDGEYIWPGEKINCGCIGRPVVEGFE